MSNKSKDIFVLVAELNRNIVVGLGTVAGHLAADTDTVVLWVDAHADINTLARYPYYPPK